MPSAKREKLFLPVNHLTWLLCPLLEISKKNSFVGFSVLNSVSSWDSFSGCVEMKHSSLSCASKECSS